MLMSFMWLPLRAIIPMVSSSRTPGVWTGAIMVVATCPSVMNRVVEAWIGVSRKPKVGSCQPDQSQRGWSINGNDRRPSVAGFAVPSTEVPAVETIRPWYIML